MKTLSLFAIATLLISSGVSAQANLCRRVFEDGVDVAALVPDRQQRLPLVVEELNQIFPHQIRILPKKNKEVLVVQAKADMIKDPVYKRFQEETVEIIITSGGGGFRHLLLRAGDKIYDYANVRSGRTGDAFRLPSEKTDAKGLVFHVGREKVQELEKSLKEFYSGNVRFNNPPFSSVAGKLVIVEKDGRLHSRSEERVWIPGGKEVSVNKNNSPIEGGLVRVNEGGKEKIYLENPDGIRTPVSQAQNGELYVYGYSCASSAVRVLKEYFEIDLFPSVSAPNLMKKILEGNEGHASAPDAMILYGPERKPALKPFEAPARTTPLPPEPTVSTSSDPSSPQPKGLLQRLRDRFLGPR
jgi:hypothetical protein